MASLPHLQELSHLAPISSTFPTVPHLVLAAREITLETTDRVGWTKTANWVIFFAANTRCSTVGRVDKMGGKHRDRCNCDHRRCSGCRIYFDQMRYGRGCCNCSNGQEFLANAHSNDSYNRSSVQYTRICDHCFPCLRLETFYSPTQTLRYKSWRYVSQCFS